MVYNYYQGVTKERLSKFAMLAIALLFGLTAAIGAIAPAKASSHSESFIFTDMVLDDKWEGD